MNLLYFLRIIVLPAFFLLTRPALHAQCSPGAAEIPQNGIDEDCDGLDDLFLFLPPYIYLAGGQDFELYFRNIVLSKHPQDYTFAVASPLPGVATVDKWTYTPPPGQHGEFPLSVTVKSAAGLPLATATCTVRVTPAGPPPDPAPRRLLLFGHSFFDQGYLPKYLYDRTHQPGNPPIAFVGSKQSWAQPLARHEGHGGRMARWFLQDPASPLRQYGPDWSVRKYFDAAVCPGCRPDWIVFHLDINDFCGYTALAGATLAEIDDTITAHWNAYTTRLIDSMRAAAPNAKIAVCISPPPNGRESAFAETYAGNPVLNNRWRWQKIVSRLAFLNAQRYGNRENENLYVLAENLDLDDFAEYNPSDARHPDPPDNNIETHCGYMEIAKSIYAWIRWVEFLPATPPTLYPYFRDDDGDGFGAAAELLPTPVVPAGYSVAGNDCDDASAAVYPGAPENCQNTIDDDCDGIIDEDATPPTAKCRPTPLTVALGAAGTVTVAPASLDNGSADACSAVALALDQSQFACIDQGFNTVTLRATDAAGNSAVCLASVKIVDNLPPVLLCPDRTVEAGTPVTLPALAPAATDNCSAATWLPFAAFTPTCQQAGAVLTVTLTAHDAAGNSASCTVQVTVQATTDTDGDGVRDCFDACPGDPATTTFHTYFNDADGDGYGEGALIFACTQLPGTVPNNFDCDDQNAAVHPGAAENCHNDTDDNCDGFIDEDLVKPHARCCPAIVLALDAAGEAALEPAAVDDGSTDTCSTVVLALSHTFFDCAGQGAHPVMLTVTDAAGLTATCTATVTIVDTVPPVLSCAGITVAPSPSYKTLVHFADLQPAGTDNCGAVTWLPFVRRPVTCMHTGSTLAFVLEAHDEAGNYSTCTAQVTVVDSIDDDADGVGDCAAAGNREAPYPDSLLNADAPALPVVYPNPASRWITVDQRAAGNEPAARVILADPLGKTIRIVEMPVFPLPISLQGLPAGCYVLYVDDRNGNRVMRRFVKF